MRRWSGADPRVARWVRLGGLTAVYFAAGKIGLHFAVVHASATAVWPPTGIAIAALLLLGLRAWPAILAGAFLVNVTTAGSALTSLGVALGNTLEAVAAVYLINRFANGRNVFDRAQDIVKFVVLAALLSAPISATVGVGSLTSGGYAAWRDFGSIWLTWWLGDAVGAVIVTPLLILGTVTAPPRGRRLGEGLLLQLSVVLSGLLIFASPNPYPLSFLCLPSLLWAAFRFGQAGVATAVAVLSFIAIWATVRGVGPFAPWSPGESLLLLQAFMGTVATTMLPVGALVRTQQRADAEREALRSAAEQAHARLEAVLDQMQAGVLIAEAPSGRMVYANRQFEVIHGRPFVPSPSFDQYGQWEGFHRDGRPYAPHEWPLARSIRAGEVVLDEDIEFGRPDGTRVTVRVRSAPIREADRIVAAVAVFQDVTQRLRDHALLEIAVEAAPNAMVMVDGEGTIILVNAETERLFQWGREELLGQSVERLVPSHLGAAHPGFRHDFFAHLSRRPMGGGRDLHAVGRDGREIPVEIGLNPIRTGRGDFVLAAIIDISERKRAEADRAALLERERTARAEAEAANRAKDDFLAMLGHELRNPLGAIATGTQILGRTAADSEHAARARAVIARQVTHLTEIVDDLLDVARVTSGRIVLTRRPVNLATVATDTVDSLHASGRTTRHRITVATEPVWIDADVTRIEQVVNNLLGNALKYTPAGGDVDVRVRDDGAQAVLEVADTGIGIASDLLPHVFDLFTQGQRTLDRSQGGLGLGLALVRRLVELHGGTVAATNDGIARGATFRVTLPRIPAPASVGDPERLEPFTGPSLRVLVVEDNLDAREMLRTFLMLEGHEVHEAADGLTGFDAFGAVQPDAAVIDIGLPALDGYELARRVRRTGFAGRLVALTGYGQLEDVRRARGAGFDEHLMKPVQPGQLRAALAGRRPPPPDTGIGQAKDPTIG